MNLAYMEVDHQRSHYRAISEAARDAFMERLVLSWLYHDHALEGIVLTQADLERAMEGMPCRNYCDNVVQRSLQRLKACIAHLEACARDGQDLSLDWIKDLHVRMSNPGDEAAGRYRKRDSSPGVYNLDVVPAASISYYFRKFIDTYENELVLHHPLRAAAIAHWEFMKVFPFDERTGVIGRLMMNFILLRHGYPPAIIHATDRHHYFAALNGHRTDLVPVLVDAVGATIAAARNFNRQFGARHEARMAL